jgi:hypothetical protein
MGDDYDRAEDEYWEARSMGYSDADIIGMDEWPKRPKDRYTLRAGDVPPARVHHRDEYGTDMYDIREHAGSDRPGRLFREALMEHKELTSPIGHPKTDKIKGEMNMINKSRAIADLKAAISAAQKELALLERIPPEPGEKLTTFTVTFSGSKPYTYVGLRIDGKWSMTGRHFNGSRYTWSGIFERFAEINARVCYVSTPIDFRHETVTP